MKEGFEYNNIAPKLRKGEQPIPEQPGKKITRVRGELVYVSAPKVFDKQYGKSPYTIRQVYEIQEIAVLQQQRQVAVQTAERIVREAQAAVLRRKEVNDSDTTS